MRRSPGLESRLQPVWPQMDEAGTPNRGPPAKMKTSVPIKVQKIRRWKQGVQHFSASSARFSATKTLATTRSPSSAAAELPGQGRGRGKQLLQNLQQMNADGERAPQVPKGQATIAQRFNVGFSAREVISPEGTAEIEPHDVRSAKVQPSLRDGHHAYPCPNVETLGYFRMSLRANSRRAENATSHARKSVICGFRFMKLLAYSYVRLSDETCFHICFACGRVRCHGGQPRSRFRYHSRPVHPG